MGSVDTMTSTDASAKLRVAVQQGNAERVGQILALEGVDPNVKAGRSLTSHTPLTQAVELDRSNIVELLLTHQDTLPDTKGNDGFTPLTLAIAKSSSTMVSLLLADQRTDVNLKEGGGLTPLHMAVSIGNKEILEMLLRDSRLEKDVKVDGLTALEFIKTSDHPDEDLVNMLA